MDSKRIVLAILLLIFGAFTAWVAVSDSIVAALVGSGPGQLWHIQTAIDLTIALGFGGAWLWRDAKSRGMSPLPWVIALPLTGSLALLAYVVLRRSRQADASRA